MIVKVRFFAGAAAAAGVPEAKVDLPDGADVAALVAALAAAHGPALARVLQASTFLVDEVAAARDQFLRDDQEIDVLPPFAGG